MSAAGRPAAVRRWLRRPVWWASAAVAVAGGLFIADIAAARSDESTFDGAYRVTGRILPSWDGGRDVDVTYRHPDSNAEVRATTYVWHSGLLPSAPGPVVLEVSRTDPTDVAVAGDRFPVAANLPYYAPWVLLPFLVYGARRWTVFRTERLMASDSVSYAMTAAASPPDWPRRGWRLHLYALDAGSAARPVCAVPLIERPAALGAFGVEVKGVPRPYARLVARDQDGVVLWPSGRALRHKA